MRKLLKCTYELAGTKVRDSLLHCQVFGSFFSFIIIKRYNTVIQRLGFVPNLFATFAYSDTALGNYLAFQGAKTSLKAKEKEVINLVVSQINRCEYCLAAHTAIGRMNGFTDEQILELRSGSASFDSKLDALVKFAKDVTINKGRPQEGSVEALFAAGYDKGSLVDIISVIGDKIISNYLNNVTQIPVDFPAAPILERASA